MMTKFNAKPNVGITLVLRRYCVGATHLPLKTKGHAK
jgi:hypothetical protein